MFKLAVFNIQHLNSNREDFFAFIFFFALNCRKDWSKFNLLTSAIPIKFRHAPELSHTVHLGIKPPVQKLPLPLFCQAPCKLAKSPFLGNSPYRNWWTPIKIFLSLTPSYLLKVSKFLVKIFPFRFLVMADKHFCLYKFFVEILVYFLFKNCNPSHLLKKSPPLFWQPPSKNWDPVRPPFLKIW